MHKPGPRERLLNAARDLTYREGLNVGVDAILRDADVARRSLYQHFGGKDGLIAEVLEQAAAQDEASYQAALDSGGNDPRERIRALFEAVDKAIAEPGYRGCRFTTAELTLTDPDHPAHVHTRGHKLRVRRMLERELRDLGHPNPPTGAEQLQLLLEGCLAMTAVHPGSQPARLAAALAEQVIGAGRG